jgi:hypothetical protein
MHVERAVGCCSGRVNNWPEHSAEVEDSEGGEGAGPFDDAFDVRDHLLFQ